MGSADPRHGKPFSMPEQSEIEEPVITVVEEPQDARPADAKDVAADLRTMNYGNARNDARPFGR